MRVCYLILAHNQPSHFARLVNALDTPDAACYIHVDPKSRLSLFTSRVPHSAAQFIKRRVSVGWGRLSMVQATLNLIRTALTAPERHDYYGLLSDTDYSIRSPAFVRQYLSEHAGNELINMVPLPHKAASKSLRLITRLHVDPERVAQRFVPQPLARGVSKMVKALPLRRSYKRGLRGFAPYSGSQWWMLSRAALEHVWTFVQDNPWYTHYFTNVPTPDESFFQTIIGNSDYRRRTHRSFTFTDWSRPVPPYPALIDETHLPRFFDGGIVADDYYGRGPMLFARKFPDDSAHLTAAIRKHAVAQGPGLAAFNGPLRVVCNLTRSCFERLDTRPSDCLPWRQWSENIDVHAWTPHRSPHHSPPAMSSMLSVILGGGAGTRLYPLTKLRAKPAVPLAGKYRLIDIPISNCINSEVNRIFVLTQFNSASLNRHIARAYRFDRFGQGFVTIIAAEQTPGSKDWFQGTADAVRRSLHHLNGYRHSHVLILSGDQLYHMDYRKLLAHHEANDAAVTLATIPVSAKDAPAFGILKTDDNNVITEFHEKPPLDELDGKESPVSPEMEEQGRIYLASMGIYLFNREVLHDMLDANPDDHDFGNSIIPAAIENRKVVSYPFEDYWSDIGTIDSFYEANLMLGRPEPPFSIYNPDRPLYTNARMLPAAKIQNSSVQHSLVAEGSVIVDSQIQNSIIGIRSFIDRGASVKDTVFMGADYYPWQPREERLVTEGPERSGIGEDSHVEGAIIDKNVSIGKRCRITNRDNVQEGESDNFYIREGIVVIPKNVEIPNDTII